MNRFKTIKLTLGKQRADQENAGNVDTSLAAKCI